MDNKTSSRVNDGIIQNDDREGYKKYILQRTMLNDIQHLKEQINILTSRILALESNQHRTP